MTFKEIANRITGISTPVFGISWNPPVLERQVAEKIITYLEDKRVLYNPFELETPEHCKQSILSIREFLTQQLFVVDRDTELSKVLRAMRNSCRKFLDTITSNELYFHTNEGRLLNNFGLAGQMLFYSGIGELRATFGIMIAKLLVMHGIDCENNLVNILPLDLEESSKS